MAGNGEYRAKSAYKDPTEAGTYDEVRFRSWKGRYADKLEKQAIGRALAVVPVGSAILDIPCGTGRITRFLLDLGYKTVGADISDEMLKYARQTLTGKENLVSLDEADAERLPYGDGQFDAATSIRLMNHVPPQVRVQMLGELRRVTRKAVIVSYCNPHSVSALKRRLKTLIIPAVAPWNPATYRQVRQEAEEAGLVITAVYPIFGPISETNVYLLQKKH